MLSSISSFTPEMAAMVTEYCTLHSSEESRRMKELWDWTCLHFEDADQMTSPLQVATIKFLAEHQQAKRILEIGCYTGYSALAWHEATYNTKAEIITLELDPNMIAASRAMIYKYVSDNRVTLIEGPAQESIQNLRGEFDIIYIDANKDGYEGYVDQIVKLQLLAPKGFIMCADVFARGMTISRDANPELTAKARSYWTECGEALRRFHTFCRSHDLIDTVLLPVFDGLTLIKWKPGMVFYPRLYMNH